VRVAGEPGARQEVAGRGGGVLAGARAGLALGGVYIDGGVGLCRA